MKCYYCNNDAVVVQNVTVSLSLFRRYIVRLGLCHLHFQMALKSKKLYEIETSLSNMFTENHSKKG